MPLQATSGAASYDAFGGGVPVVPNYIEDVFSTYLYTGNGSTQTITNGIDLSTKGGLVWFKSRSGTYGTQSHVLTSNELTNWTKYLSSNTTGDTAGLGATAFTPSTTGFALNSVFAGINDSGTTYASWTFRKAPKFFDVVTYTGDGNLGRTVAHNLGSVPGCIIIKNTGTGGTNWGVYHRSVGATGALFLNQTYDVNTSSNYWNNTAPTSTVFTVGNQDWNNQSGESYVAYVFAHDAGGFGLTGTDNVISCGSFDANNGEVINLGYEPQWLLYKASSDVDNWRIADNMRGLTNLAGTNAQTIKQLRPNSSAVESENSGPVLTSTGFTWNQSGGGVTHIYIAIRRGPMKVPTSGTSVFLPTARTGTGTNTTITTGFVNDSVWSSQRAGGYRGVFDRLRGANILLFQNVTSAESTYTDTLTGFDNNTGVNVGVDASWGGINLSGASDITYSFQRAPSFFDVVCYTGTGSANTAFTHNLTVTPELMIVKPRSAATAPNWRVWSPINSTDFNLLQLSTNGAASSSLYSSSNVFPAIPTATTFTVGGSGSIQLNESGQTFVAYLFATCAGVSKCGTFTGNGSSQTINCGFTGGARFVMIKATSTTGDWMVADSARGIVSGSDPYLELNNTNAEVTGEDWLDTDSTGFVVNEVSGSNANTNGVTYIFLAIA